MAEITTSVQIVLPQHCNGYKRPRLFGGQMMAWIDIVGAVAARRYTQCAVTTVCIDNLSFLNPAFLNDTVVQEAQVVWTGRTSLEVRVDSYVEQLDATRKRVNRAYLLFVAIDDNDRPVPVPPLVPVTEEEKREFEQGEQRKKQRMNS